MPEESLFNEPPAPDPATPPAGEGSPESPDNGHASGGSGGLTREAVEAMIAPVQADLLATRNELATVNADRQQLQTQIAQLQKPVEPEPSNEDWVNRFSDDPQKVIAEEAEKLVQTRMQQLAPFLEQQNNTQHDALVNTQKASVDAAYGEGTWDAEFDAPFQARMNQLRQSNAQGLSDPAVIRNTTLELTGLKINELTDRKAGLAKANTEAQEVADQRLLDRFSAGTGMTGGQRIAPVSISRELSPAEKAFLASKELDGGTANIQDLRESASRDGTLESYQAAQAAKEKK